MTCLSDVTADSTGKAPPPPPLPPPPPPSQRNPETPASRRAAPGGAHPPARAANQPCRPRPPAVGSANVPTRCQQPPPPPAVAAGRDESARPTTRLAGSPPLRRDAGRRRTTPPSTLSRRDARGRSFGRTRRRPGAPSLHPHRRAAAGSRRRAFRTPSLLVVADCVAARRRRRAARFVGRRKSEDKHRTINLVAKRASFLFSFLQTGSHHPVQDDPPQNLVADSLKFEVVKT